MSKVDVGDLKKLIKQQPDMAATVAFAQRILLISAANFGDFTSFVVAGREETTPEIIVSKTELVKFAREVIEKHGTSGPSMSWWVTNHDAPEESKRVSGPYSTSADAGRAREILERFEHHHNYWIEELAP